MTIAVDKGTTYTKTSALINFKSIIREYHDDEILFCQDKIIVRYNNKPYVIGENGKTNTDLFKSKHEETKLMILTAIALSYPHQTKIKTDLITGLPIGRYGYERKEMNSLLQYTRNDIIVNDIEYTIDINNVETFPEGASSFYSLTDEDNGLLVDIGGLSIDISLFTKGNKLEKYSTYRLGIMPLYREIANYIGSKYSITIDEWKVEEIIKNGLFIDGEKQDLDIDTIINQYIERISQALRFDYNVPAIKNIFLTGGGGAFLHPYIQKIIPRIRLMQNPQFTNVLSYQLLGEVLFDEKN